MMELDEAIAILKNEIMVNKELASFYERSKESYEFYRNKADALETVLTYVEKNGTELL